MKPLPLVLVAIAASSLLILLTQQGSHHKLHECLTIKNLCVEGTTIGVVIDEMRNSSLLPVEPNEFGERYAKICRIKWEAATNSSGDLILSLQGRALWSVGSTDGRVRRIGAVQP